MDARPVDFLTFFVLWARVQGWKVPLLHVRICIWLDTCAAPERVLMVFRGAAKSTIYAVYKAYRLYKNRSHRSLIWSADNDTAGMLTADTLNVLRNHPLTRGMLPPKHGTKRFWVVGAKDARNASMRANGVRKNATGARADDVDFDDVEVPGNIETPEARNVLRRRISESTHIAVPGAQKTYIGTPHTHDSIYPERIEGGADVLKIALFEHAMRFRPKEGKARKRFRFPHPVGADGLYVMAGIHKGARMLQEGKDYTREGQDVVFTRPPGVVIDIASMCAWPERFTRDEIALRRKETLTLNAWDSQYMLEAKPLDEIRLDPAQIPAYDCEPRFVTANKRLTMWLGAVQIVSCSLRWDPSSGNVKRDASAAALSLQDATGRHYLHRMVALTGEIAETNERGDRITGGQVWQLADIVEKFNVPRVVIETNGIGGYAPAFMKTVLKQRKIRCGVSEVQAVSNKNKRILEAWEPLIESSMVWGHVDVLNGPLWDQMKDWNPAAPNQPDDLLDAGAGAFTDQPARIGQLVRNVDHDRNDDWRPSAGVFEATLEA